MKRLIFFLLFSTALLAQQKYDLLIKGGTVIDAKNGIHEVKDVAIRDRKIAAVEKNIPSKDASKTINAEGFYVTPGLVDIHAHVYAAPAIPDAYNGDNSIYPDGFTFRSCVTTVADAGSSGWR